MKSKTLSLLENMQSNLHEDSTRFGTYKPGDLVKIQDKYSGKYYGKFKVIRELSAEETKSRFGTEVIGYEVESLIDGFTKGEKSFTNNYRMEPYIEEK